MIDNDHRQRAARRQLRLKGGGKIFQLALQREIQRRDDFSVGRERQQTARQQRRGLRHLARRQPDRLLQDLVDLLLRPDTVFSQALQHLIARRLGALRPAIRAQAARRLRQHRQQRGLAFRQLRGRLTKPDPACRAHALDRAAKRGTIEIERQNLALRQVPLQLQRPPRLHRLAGEAARLRIDQARHLHGQRAAAGNDGASAQILPGRAQDGDGIDAGMTPEPAIFVVEQRLKVGGRDLLCRDRIAPDALLISEAPERRAIFRDHHARRLHLAQRQRKQPVESEKRQRQR